MRRPTQPVWYSLAVILVSMAMMFVYTSVSLDRSAGDSERRAKATAAEAERVARAAARESEQRWCSLIATMDEAYSVAPPTTEIGRKLARDIKALRVGFDCP